MKVYAITDWADPCAHEFDVTEADLLDDGTLLVHCKNIPTVLTEDMWASSPEDLAVKAYDRLMCIRDDVRRYYDRTGDFLLALEFGTVPIRDDELSADVCLPSFSRRPKP